ncbi:hypothetical protein GH714_012100 [Hevea brasiliensis]|uniref:Uncharacterized protein n=1 Tax=Hevea brasiliensis TaxID=3981 RepID=A0A6A6KZM7_HEVBR|nr:hypothetical protein GH714_012100 [Hevea brasiliensis]
MNPASSLKTAILRNAKIEGKSSVNGHNLMKHRSQANKSGNSMEEKPKRIKACASSFHKSLENSGSVEPMGRESGEPSPTMSSSYDGSG